MEALVLIIAVMVTAWPIPIIVAIVFASWVAQNWSRAKKYDELKPKLDNLDNYKRALEAKETDLSNRQKEWEEKVQSDIAAINTLAEEKSEGFPWLAKAYADYFHLQELKRASYLEHKAYPALTAAEHVRDIASERRKAEERCRTLEYKLAYYESYKGELDSYKPQLPNDRTQMMEAINALAKEKSHGFPWLAQAYADYFHLQDLRRASYLEHKAYPALKAAEHVREVASARRIAEKLYRTLKYQLEYYEKLFPWLVEFTSEDIDDLIRTFLDKKGRDALEEPEEPERKWLTDPEYQNLPTVERNQRALDRYSQRKKSKWEIGRDYERYIGYSYEMSGYNVYYQGIIEGLEDLGRDLIAVKGDNIEIVQCKCWSQERTIYEKHIFQLFGTTIEYYLKNMENKQPFQPALFPELLRSEGIKARFITSTKLSEKAKGFARVLQVEVVENFPLQHYPSIKCNVSRRTGEKIYHLPFDQQYDRTLVEEERNECYVETVKEAEALGFRRAFRWRGEISG